jgi:hypothetical protein
MYVRSDQEGHAICEQLRAAGVKCAVESLPDANSFRNIWGLPIPNVLTVLVNESDMDKARRVMTEYEKRQRSEPGPG